MGKEGFVKWLWFFMFAVLCFPFVQHCTDIITSNNLSGDYDIAPDTKFSKQAWWDGSYQEQKGKYVNDNMGFRADIVRAGIQLDFSVFRKAKGKYVGKENYLFYDNYVNAYRGTDFMGHDSIRRVALKMKYVQEQFEKENKTLLMTVAGSKAEYYPEYLPDWPGNKKVGPTNREVFREYCTKLGINFLDFNDHLWEIKKTTKHTLYGRQSIHWTRYGATFAVDTVIRLVERLRGIDLPNPDFSNLKTEYTSDPMDGLDVDMKVSLNLFIPIKEHFTYAVTTVPRTANTTSISSIYVGDSFFWLLQSDSLGSVNHRYEFWHYFKDIFVERERNNHCISHIGEFDWRKSLDSTDVVMILYTPMNLHMVEAFVDSAYIYCKEKELTSLATAGDAIKKK